MIIMEARVWKDGKHWLIECPSIGAVTQGRSKDDALRMLVDWIRTYIDDESFGVSVELEEGEVARVYCPDPMPILALVIAHARQESGLTMDQVASEAGLKSRSNIAHYESGKHDPTFSKALKVLSAMGFDLEIAVKKKA